ncbi:MAG: hypothetical protein JO316_15135 [Abitibacteriaceae bacterium]|nr:hypothetical protein [Abditibacteriaceae bacterium]MBV9866686.1 hypothetical protein [Abditibacteriaceae bacterium]
MASKITVYAGTVGQGVWRSGDDGETFQRACAGMFMEATVRALAVHPQNSQVLYAGTDAGLYRTEDGGAHWQAVEGPFASADGWAAPMAIWSLLIHPTQPNTVFVGTCPPALYRAQDAGASWEKLDADLVAECGPIIYSRVTCITADPTNANIIWAGIEIDGVRRSTDGGNTWQRLDTGLSSSDIHSIAVVPGTPKTVLAATNNDLNVSTDEGQTWQPQQVKEKFPWGYCRGIVAKADEAHTLFLGNGNGPPGTAGALQISRDGGQHWTNADLTPAPNSTVWTFAINSADPNLIFCTVINGYLYRSRDGGTAWQKCQHEFGEVRALAWTMQ